jgi:hypothetical protein
MKVFKQVLIRKVSKSGPKPQKWAKGGGYPPPKTVREGPDLVKNGQKVTLLPLIYTPKWSKWVKNQ